MSYSAVKPGPHLQTRLPTYTRLPLLSRDGVYVVFQKLALCACHVSASHLELLITSHWLASSEHDGIQLMKKGNLRVETIAVHPRLFYS